MRTFAARLAWSLTGLYAAMFVAAVALTFLSLPAGSTPPSSFVGDFLVFVPFTAFPIVGALVASRHPRNPIGWICLADGLLWMLIILGEEYSAYGFANPGSVPFPVTINALLYAWLWVPAVGLLGTFLLLLFPDGRLPSRKWRPLAFLSGTVILVVSVLTFVIPGPLEGIGGAKICRTAYTHGVGNPLSLCATSVHVEELACHRITVPSVNHSWE